MPTVHSYAMSSPTSAFGPFELERRAPGPTEVFIDIAYCGVCHSDIHTARAEWPKVPAYPFVPGHEITGHVRSVGANVTDLKPGDRVGVGCMVDSCGTCEFCQQGLEQFCRRGVWTYNSIGRDRLPTQGGYSQGITVERAWVFRIPDNLDLARTAPLLCAGATTYSPLKYYGAGPGTKVAIVGMGGLGHVAVQIAAALGAEVSVISQTRSKEADGLAFGAVDYFAAGEDGTFRRLMGRFDLILTTVAAADDFTDYINCLRTGGTLVNVGMPSGVTSLWIKALSNRKSVAGSLIAGRAEHQEMLDFCGAHNIQATVELIGAPDITAAYDKVIASQVRYRYVIDASTLG
ncbi:MAG: NAD(P)-dependent alcohol dehydrogenase [Propionibacteriaceae bacterium]|jgi:uncharacterized zinc-type alcohol dehydrogenase-like protein|nr:NAD(P)-dependent alcohol dehydrogenase [Propionibacteriaceae bacterium]